MPHDHPIYDSDKHFVIDPITRDITNQSSKITIMQYDHNSERFTFEIPKVIEGHDMSLCNSVRIHYINIGSVKADSNYGVYEVDDLDVSLDDPDTITFSWLIKGSATEYSGSLNFAIRFYCISDENDIDYSWGTNIYSGIKVSNGLDNSETIVEYYVDVLEQWKQDVIDTCIDYNITNSPYKYVKSPDSDGTLVNLRDLSSGTYILEGRFVAFQDGDAQKTVTFSYGLPVTICKSSTKTYLQCIYPPNNTIQYVEISDDGFYRNDALLENVIVGKIRSLTLPASDWISASESNSSLFKQTVSVSGITARHKVDLLPTPEQMQELLVSEISLTVVNEGYAGEVTAYSIGGKPTVDYTIQAMLTEVNSE